MRALKIGLPVVVVLLLLLLVRQNLEVFNHQVEFRLNLLAFTLRSAPHRLWVILLYTLLLGVVGTGLYSLVEVVKLRRANRQLRHDLEMLKSEMQTLHGEVQEPPAASPASSPT